MATEDLSNRDTGPEPRGAYFDHEGTPLAYIDQGTGPVTVVAVPGLPGSTREFRWLVPALMPRSVSTPSSPSARLKRFHTGGSRSPTAG